MLLETWLAYAAAAIVLTLIPGPSVLFVTGTALRWGLRAALVAVVASALGAASLMVLSLMGVGAALAASAMAFAIVKWAGVVYMIWLGWRQIQGASRISAPAADVARPANARGVFRSGLAAAVLNPKSIAFYAALLTQFIDPARDVVLQCGILISTSVALSLLVLAGYALLAARVRTRLSSIRGQRAAGYVGGGFMLGGGALLAATR
ncbi:MAG: LysE family transporter [Alphaproteobacteria bacterium]